jgi:hypothetical protein
MLMRLHAYIALQPVLYLTHGQIQEFVIEGGGKLVKCCRHLTLSTVRASFKGNTGHDERCEGL